MSESNEPYVAALAGVQNGGPVTYGNEFIAASNDDEAKIKALDWANNLHQQIGEKANLILKKGKRGVYSHEFDAAH